MNKKFLSAILFGALVASSTGTFVSCKDYDDDITELWDAVNGQKTDLSTKITAVETSVSSLQSAQTGLQTEIAAAKAAAAAAQTAADKAAADAKVAALEAQEAAIATAAKELATVKTALEAAIAAGDAKSNEAAAKALEAAVKELSAKDAAVAEAAAAALKAAKAELEAADKTAAEALKDLEKNLEAEIAEVSGAVAVIEKAYQGADDAILEKLATAEATLSDQIKNLDAKVTANAKTIGEMQTALEAQKTALENYKKANGADVKDIQDRLTSCEKALAALEAFDVELNQKDIDKLKKDFEALDTKITKEINPQLALLSAAVFQGVTHVSLVSNWQEEEEYSWDLDFTTVIEKANKFGEGVVKAGEEMVFEKDKQVQRTAKFVVRVSPTNAQLTPEMITLQNSLGETLEIVKVKQLSAYDKLLTTTRSISAGGLWVVEAELTSYEKETFNKLAKADKETILYAVAVNNTEVAGRNVISTYDLTLKHSDFKGLNKLNYFVGETNVNVINNRYALKYQEDGIDKDNKSLVDYKGDAKLYKELAWKGKADVAANKLENGTPKSDSNAMIAIDDDRSDKDLYPAVYGAKIPVTIGELKDGKIVANTKEVKGMYITLDHQANAVESAPSEWVAWNNYDIEGLNEVVEGASTTITIKPGKNNAIDDIIGFRVYAVNYDGTLVDPDGKAFYVKVGEEGITVPAIETKVVATYAEWKDDNYSNIVKFADKQFEGISEVASWEWTADGIGNDYARVNGEELLNNKSNGFRVSLFDKNGGELFTTAESESKIEDLSKVVAVKTMFNHPLKYVLDNTKLNGTLVLKNKDGFVLATINVSIEKVLPDVAPADDKFSAKDKQIVNGVYNCFLTPNTYNMNNALTEKNEVAEKDLAATGTVDLAQVFNGWSSSYVPSTYKDNKVVNCGKNGYQVQFENAELNEETEKYTKTLKSNTTSVVSIDAALIDNKETHATNIKYVYAGVSTYVKDGKYYEGQDRPVKAFEQFNTIFTCFMDDPVQTWRWIEAAEVDASFKVADDGTWYRDTNKNGKYDEGIDANADHRKPTTSVMYGTSNVTVKYTEIMGVNTYDKQYSGNLKDKNTTILRVINATITSNGTGNEDYFEFDSWVASNGGITFKQKSVTTVPTGDVASTLTVTYVDMYGHKHDVKLPFTVKK